ncbi:hypothetical protein [Saccharicrinis sp. 156]|uniref:hypothetical protein n=1 Tax=Saccharicrinis sp. 156 TaxID=3417574 RepID=UPI003D34B229
MIILAYILLRMLLGGSPATVKGEALINAHWGFSDWVCVKDMDGIKLLERWVRVNDTLKVRERKGEMIVECSMQEAVSYLADYSTVKQWMKGLKSIELQDEDRKLIYMVIKLPWPFIDRDLFARYSLYKLDKENSVVKVESERNVQAPNSRLVRISNYRASWNVQRISSNRTKVVFTTFSSEPPIFPQWIQEPVLKRIFYGNLKRLKDQLSGRAKHNI